MTIEVTDWISAVSDAAAAVGTVGALWVGAIILRRQVNDQHRAQASAVTVSVQKTKQNGEILEFMVQNDSPLPIYEVMLIASDRGNDIHQDLVAAMPPRTRTTFQLRDTSYMGCRAKFYDSSGKRWVRHFNGQLRASHQSGRADWNCFISPSKPMIRLKDPAGYGLVHETN